MCVLGGGGGGAQIIMASIDISRGAYTPQRN